MTRTVSMDRYGNFTVSDDPDGVIAVALLVATTTQNCDRVAVELAPDGGGLHVQGIGSIDRVTAREELPDGFDEDPSVDPEAQELWRLFREPDHRFRSMGEYVLTGGELRDLVNRALELRRQAGFVRETD